MGKSRELSKRKPIPIHLTNYAFIFPKKKLHSKSLSQIVKDTVSKLKHAKVHYAVWLEAVNHCTGHRKRTSERVNQTEPILFPCRKTKFYVLFKHFFVVDFLRDGKGGKVRDVS